MEDYCSSNVVKEKEKEKVSVARIEQSLRTLKKSVYFFHRAQ